MDIYTISIFGNKIFFEIIKEIKLFSKFKAQYYEDIDICIKHAKKENQIVIFFINKLNKIFFNKVKINDFPLIWVVESSISKKILSSVLSEQMNMPFKILDLKKKITSLIAKNEFKKNSLIHLDNYIIDKNERRIKRGNSELQLSEKEVNFLILFSENAKPINRNFVLKNVWNYLPGTQTHTVETHIHRLRKKIFEKFGDSDFIKNNKKGYYI